MYRKLGYEECTTIGEFTCEAAEEAVALHRIDRDAYSAARRSFLPEGGVVQENENIAYLENMAFFYQGTDFLLCARKENRELHAPEILGNTNAAPGILKALNCRKGTFRTPGGDIPFAMCLPFEEGVRKPTYLGLAFD